MVLESIENALHSPKSEGVLASTGSLTIEHIMPQSWEQHWPIANSEDLEAVDARRRLVQTIGNLTLVSHKLNPALSNGPWQEKRRGLHEHSVLYLNKHVVNHDVWNEDTIRARSKELAEVAAHCWSRPTPA
jgi:hypothetical protein